MACWLWLCGVVGAEGLHWAQLTWPAATPPTHQADTADKTDVSCHTSHVTRHTSHSQMESGASLQLVREIILRENWEMGESTLESLQL